jgi:hypothetical protein
MKLLEIINNEFSEGRSRKEMGAGVEHKVFPSTTDPNIVYKLGSKKSIDSWFEEFKQDPSIFPKVYRRGSTKVKLKSDLPFYRLKKGSTSFSAGTVVPMDYVEMEKLDTTRVNKEWDLLDEMLETLTERDGYEFLDFLIILMTNSPEAKANGYDSDATIAKVDEEVKKYYPQLYPIFMNYINLTEKIQKVSKQVPDLHRHNFGYDNKGRLKCLDF